MYFFICLFVCLLAYEVMGNGNVYCVSSTRITIEGIEKLNKNKTINSREPLDSLLLLPWLKKNNNNNRAATHSGRAITLIY